MRPTKLQTQIRLLSSEDPSVSREAARKLRFLGAGVIGPLKRNGSLEALRLAYEMGHFHVLSEAQKRKLCLAWLAAGADVGAGRERAFMRSGAFTSGTPGGLDEPLIRHILANRKAFYPELSQRTGESQRAAQVIALWGADKAALVEIYRTRKVEWIAPVLWACRDMDIARELFADESVPWPVAERALLVAVGASPYSLLNRPNQKDRETQRRAAWRKLLSNDNKGLINWRTNAVNKGAGALNTFLVESKARIKAAEKQADAYGAYGDLEVSTYDGLVRAAVTFVLQGRTRAIGDLERAKANLAKLEDLGPRIGLWPVFETQVIAILDQAVRRLKDKRPWLPPARQIERTTVRRISVDRRIAAIRAAIIADRPTVSRKAWRAVLEGPDPKPVYADLPLSVLRRLKKDPNRTVKTFAATRILWRSGMKIGQSNAAASRAEAKQ